MDIIKILMIIWIASYPKSGNTWLRSIITSLLYTTDGIFDFKLIKKIKQFPTRNQFQEFTKNFNDINEISKFWLLAQDKINLTEEIKFFKTHNLNYTVNKNSFTKKMILYYLVNGNSQQMMINVVLFINMMKMK